MRVLVIGGEGDIGGRLVRLLTEMGLGAVAASRRAGLRGGAFFDLERPETFVALRGFDLVLDASAGSPEGIAGMARWCLDEGVMLATLSADPGVVAALGALDPAESAGAVVVGVGLCPGLSTLAGGALLDAFPAARGLDLGFRYRPWSGAGRGTARLMMHPETLREVGGVVSLPFWGGEAPAARCVLADALLLDGRFTGRRVVLRTGLALPLPPGTRLLALALPWLAGHERLRSALEAPLGLLRSTVLRGVTSPFEICLVLHEERSSGDPPWLRLRAADGRQGVVRAAAATARLLLDRRPAPGVHAVHEVLRLADVLEAMEGLGGPPCSIDVMASDGSLIARGDDAAPSR